ARRTRPMKPKGAIEAQGRLRRSQQLLQFLNSHTDVGEDPGECSFGDIATFVHRDRRATPVRVPHDVMTACHADSLEPGPFQRPDDPLTTYRRDRWHQATSTVSASSCGGPNSAIRPSSASRKSAMAASRLSPSPFAPTPGRNCAWAHQIPSSSCSTVYGTCT